jgi:hypothetical protein
VGPNHPTALLRDAKQQFKSIGNFGLRVYLEACPTGRIVNNVAINQGSFRANDYFGLGTPARRANASKVSRIHYRPLPLIRNSSDRLTDYPENFVSVYGYRNTSCGGQQGTSQQTSFAGAAGEQDREPIHSRRFRKLNFATEQQMKSSGGAVAGLSSQATRLARDAISFERTMARGAQPGLRWIDY